MQFQIEIINVQATTKPTKQGSYVQLDVAYKKLADGKIEGKKIMSFAQRDAYAILSKATNGNQFTVTSEKDGEYWQWVKVDPLTGATQSTTEAPQSKGFASPKSTYETPEERAKKQVLIVRQSCLAQAIDTLSVNPGKDKIQIEDVFTVADDYVQWIFQKETKPDMNFADMDDDVPM